MLPEWASKMFLVSAIDVDAVDVSAVEVESLESREDSDETGDFEKPWKQCDQIVAIFETSIAANFVEKAASPNMCRILGDILKKHHFSSKNCCDYF